MSDMTHSEAEEELAVAGGLEDVQEALASSSLAVRRTASVYIST